MTASKVIEISAFGTRGKALNKKFVAKLDSRSRYVLNKKVSSKSTTNATNEATNKVYANSLDEAAELLATDQYLINLVSGEGKRALREFKKVKIVRR